MPVNDWVEHTSAIFVDKGVEGRISEVNEDTGVNIVDDVLPLRPYQQILLCATYVRGKTLG